MESVLMGGVYMSYICMLRVCMWNITMRQSINVWVIMMTGVAECVVLVRVIMESLIVVRYVCMGCVPMWSINVKNIGVGCISMSGISV